MPTAASRSRRKALRDLPSTGQPPWQGPFPEARLVTTEEADRFLANKQTVLDSLKDRGAAIRRLDIPMREPSVDFPSAAVVDVEPFRPPEEGEAAQTK